MDNNEINYLVEKTENAYSFNRYGESNWRECIKMLADKGLNADEIEAVMCSKWTRWAGDMSNNPYGNVTAQDLAKYIRQCEPNLKATIHSDLL